MKQSERLRPILQSADDDLKEKARKGQFTINEAFNKIKRLEKRNALLNEVSPISLTGGKQKGLELLQGDFLEQSKNIPDNSIDLIFTDHRSSIWGREYSLASRACYAGWSCVESRR